MNTQWLSVTGIGQDSHRFSASAKPLLLGGAVFADEIGLEGNSDADVILHAICRAMGSLTGKPILGATADLLCQQGITNSAVYLEHALQAMHNHIIDHIAVCIEAQQPKIDPKIPIITASICALCNIQNDQVGITATSGEGMSAMGKGLGMQAFVVLSARKRVAGHSF